MKTNGVPKIRFKGFTDDWEQRKLGEMGSTYTQCGIDIPDCRTGRNSGWTGNGTVE